MEWWTDGWTGGQAGGQTNGQVGGWVRDRRTAGQTDGQMDGLTDWRLIDLLKTDCPKPMTSSRTNKQIIKSISITLPCLFPQVEFGVVV